MDNTDEVYYVNFDTRISPGKLEATRVTIGVETISNMELPLAINLCDHPLYRDLWDYCRANPPR